MAGQARRARCAACGAGICSSIPRATMARVSVALFIRHGKASAFARHRLRPALAARASSSPSSSAQWLAGQKLHVDAVFLGPRKRHAQTHEAVTRVLGDARPVASPSPRCCPSSTSTTASSLVYKLLPELAADDPALRSIVEATVQGRAPVARRRPRARSSASRGAGCAARSATTTWSRGPTFRARVGRALPRIARIGRGKTALVFTSAGVVASAVADALGVREEEKVLDLSWSLYNGSMTELDFADDRWGLRTFNATAHLDDGASSPRCKLGA